MIILIFLITSCRGTHYVGQHFYFPAGAKPDDRDWIYHGYVHMSLVDQWFDLNEKNIKIFLSNRDGKEFKLDQFTVMSRGLSVEAIWEKEDLLVITFTEDEGPPIIDGKPDFTQQSKQGKVIKKITYNPAARLQFK
ncbi:hypothetical protein [Undibacterium pigrum]|uniref:hypothetical protein n=1 Tax=Undibacterium pigrum TaxID=401470 RepID=UPI001473A952|nr:hypothetical protein [Undibacterium pigrum]